MKPLRSLLSNNHGYALILVLLTITIFILFGFTFMASALNTTKQSSIIEDRIQATDLAEMGTEYYSHVLDEEIDKIINKLELWLISVGIPSITPQQWKDKTLTDIENILTTGAIKEAENLLKSQIYPLNYKTKTMDHDDKLTFQIRIINQSEKLIRYEVIGETEDSKASITSTVHLDTNKIKVSLNDKDSWIDTIAPDGEFGNCDLDEMNFKDKKCKIGTRIFDNSDKNNLTFSNSQIKVSGNLTIPNINNTNLANSTFYVEGNFYNTNNLNKVSNYNLFVGGEARIGNTNEATNAKICVNRLLEYQGGDATVYANELGPDPEKNIKGDVIIDSVAFKNNCNWNPGTVYGNPIIQKKFNYK